MPDEVFKYHQLNECSVLQCVAAQRVYQCAHCMHNKVVASECERKVQGLDTCKHVTTVTTLQHTATHYNTLSQL